MAFTINYAEISADQNAAITNILLKEYAEIDLANNANTINDDLSISGATTQDDAIDAIYETLGRLGIEAKQNSGSDEEGTPSGTTGTATKAKPKAKSKASKAKLKDSDEARIDAKFDQQNAIWQTAREEFKLNKIVVQRLSLRAIKDNLGASEFGYTVPSTVLPDNGTVSDTELNRLVALTTVNGHKGSKVIDEDRQKLLDLIAAIRGEVALTADDALEQTITNGVRVSTLNAGKTVMTKDEVKAAKEDGTNSNRPAFIQREYPNGRVTQEPLNEPNLATEVKAPSTSSFSYPITYPTTMKEKGIEYTANGTTSIVTLEEFDPTLRTKYGYAINCNEGTTTAVPGLKGIVFTVKSATETSSKEDAGTGKTAKAVSVRGFTPMTNPSKEGRPYSEVFDRFKAGILPLETTIRTDKTKKGSVSVLYTDAGDNTIRINTVSSSAKAQANGGFVTAPLKLKLSFAAPMFEYPDSDLAKQFKVKRDSEGVGGNPTDKSAAEYSKEFIKAETASAADTNAFLDSIFPDEGPSNAGPGGGNIQ